MSYDKKDMMFDAEWLVGNTLSKKEAFDFIVYVYNKGRSSMKEAVVKKLEQLN